MSDAPSPTVMLRSARDGFSLPAFHAPAIGKRRGGVVVIQEIFGDTDHVKAMCAAFAAAGYETLAPDVFARIEPGFQADHDAQGISKGRAAVEATPWDQLAGDMQAAIDVLRSDGPVFLTGFCYGGAAAWLGAARCSGLAAASGFYGRLINALLDDTPQAPIILHCGEKDGAIPMRMVEEVRARHPYVPVHVYDAGHGFCREGSGDFDAPARDLALARTLAHFSAHAG
jgi:carboxymethylenebutenolidase